jgi:membrane protein insertase Oxa1/YidC/SpoIIIJ
MLFIWNEILFRPLLNLLVGLYNTIGLQNLGLAIIWLTILTRIALLPFFFAAERQKQKHVELNKELLKLQRSFSNNPSVLRDEQRKIFKRLKIRRWPKIISLAIQGLILVLLYQVFVGGINLAEIVDSLYSFVHVPRSVQTFFLGVDVAEKSILLSLIPAALLALTIVIDHGGFKIKWTQRDFGLLIGFPLLTFAILYSLPSVKALFVMSSQLFSLGFRLLTNFFASIAHQDKLIREKNEKLRTAGKEGIPHPRSRFD